MSIVAFTSANTLTKEELSVYYRELARFRGNEKHLEQVVIEKDYNKIQENLKQFLDCHEEKSDDFWNKYTEYTGKVYPINSEGFFSIEDVELAFRKGFYSVIDKVNEVINKGRF